MGSCGGREVLRETREEVTKSGEVLRESRLVFFEWSGGGIEKQFLLLACAWFSLCSTLAFGSCPSAFRDDLLFFDPDCPVLVYPFPF